MNVEERELSRHLFASERLAECAMFTEKAAPNAAGKKARSSSATCETRRVVMAQAFRRLTHITLDQTFEIFQPHD